LAIVGGQQEVPTHLEYAGHFTDGAWWIRYPGDDAQRNDQSVSLIIHLQAQDISLSTTKNPVQLFLAGAFLSRPHHGRTGINGVDVETAGSKCDGESPRPTADFENS
jgi:hypothetical protein